LKPICNRASPGFFCKFSGVGRSLQHVIEEVTHPVFVIGSLTSAWRRSRKSSRIWTAGSDEKDEVFTNCEHLQNLKFSSVYPRAFTEHGVVMVAAVLNTPRSVEMNLAVVRAFIKLREMVVSHKELAEKLNAVGQKYDDQFRVVFEAIRQLKYTALI
jgi:hypothetical protein